LNDTRAAVAAYNEAEDQYQHLDRFEVVLVGADGIDMVMATHGHYIRSPVVSLFSGFLSNPVRA